MNFGTFFCKQKLHNALFRLDYSFQVCLQSNKFSAAGKRWTSKLKILLWQMPNLMKHTIIQIISEGLFKFLCLQCFDLIHAPKRSNKNFINGRKIQSLDINVTLIHQSMYSSYMINKKYPVIFWLDWQKYKSFPCLIVCMRFHKHTIMTHSQ